MNRIVDPEITLVKYYPNYQTALQWYQDPRLCKQVDNRDTVYDLPLLKRMYKYLDQRGDLFYIKYRGRLCGDVCLQHSGEVNIVIAGPYQNRHIGRRVLGEVIRLGREKQLNQFHAEIYSFNAQSRKMFTAMGFQKTGEESFILNLS